MTNPTDEELDEMARDLCHTGELSMPYRCEISDAICALRTQLADAWARLDYWCERSVEWDAEMLQKDREVLEAIARAERAEQRVATLEAALAAQIEADAGIADDFHRRAIEWAKTVRGLEKHIGETDSSRIATAIRAQPHDRTALDRMLAEAEARGIKRAADRTLGLATGHECRTAILAMIEKPDAT